MNQKDRDKIAWLLIAGASAMLANRLARSAMTAGWSRVRGVEPPDEPAHRDTSWGDALAWAALSGVVGGITGVLVTRGAALGWHRATGKWPPVS